MPDLKEKFQNFVKQNGDWSAHNIHIKDDVYTISSNIVNDEFKLKRVIQNIKDITKKDFKELRILDLACLEGLFGIECARHGAEVTFLDAREENLKKVEFVTQSLNLTKVNIVLDDVRQISSAKYGNFDVILCFGIFYHLDKSDLFDFVRRMYEMCNCFVFFDTQIALNINEAFDENNVSYFGKSYLEHRKDATENEMKSDLWKSIGNKYSFKMTKVSLVRLLNNIGFTSVFESYLPFDKTKNRTRVSFIAMKGVNSELISTPQINDNNNYFSEETTKSLIFKENMMLLKNDILYSIRLKSPRFVRNLYKKYLKREKKYKAIKPADK